MLGAFLKSNTKDEAARDTKVIPFKTQDQGEQSTKLQEKASPDRPAPGGGMFARLVSQQQQSPRSNGSQDDDGAGSMNASLKNALFKMMQNKEQDSTAKAQFKADIDNMNETMKFALQSLDEKLTSTIDIMERKLKYQVDGF